MAPLVSQAAEDAEEGGIALKTQGSFAVGGTVIRVRTETHFTATMPTSSIRSRQIRPLPATRDVARRRTVLEDLGIDARRARWLPEHFSPAWLFDLHYR